MIYGFTVGLIGQQLLGWKHGQSKKYLHRNLLYKPLIFLVQKGVNGRGGTIFKKLYYLNRVASEQALLQKKMESQRVWYNFSNPKLNSLHRSFPYKKCFHALISLGVLNYFFYIHYDVKNLSSKA